MSGVVVRLSAAVACLAAALLAGRRAHGWGRVDVGSGRSVGSGRWSIADIGRGLGGVAPRWLVAGGVLVVSLAALAAGPLAAVLASAALGAVTLQRHLRGLGAGRRYDAALVEFIEGLARQLRSGATLHVALDEAVAPADAELARDVARLRADLAVNGLTLPEALRRWHAARRRSSVVLLCAVLAAGHRSGSLRARSIDELAAVMRQLDDARREGAALAAQAQASAAVMVCAPIGFSVLLAASDTTARAFFTETALGAVCVAGGLLLDLAAATVMARAVIGTGDAL